MNNNQKKLWIVGLPDGDTSLTMCAYAGKHGYECHSVLPEDLEHCIHVLRDRQTSVPLAVESSYSPEQLAHISRAVLVGGVRLVPVGQVEDWESVIPLEMPELYAMTVAPIESEWYAGAWVTTPVTQATEHAPFCMVNGTMVCRVTPELAEPLADLNQSYADPVPVVVATPCKKKTDTTLYLLIALLGVVVLTLVGTFCVLLLPAPESELDSENYALQEEQNVTAPLVEQQEPVPQEKPEDNVGVPVAPIEVAPAQQDSSPLAEHQKNVCPHIDRRAARPGNAAYLQLEEGKKLGCPQCTESLNEPLVQHTCPKKEDKDYSMLLAQGEKIGCDACKAALETFIKESSAQPVTRAVPQTSAKKQPPQKAVTTRKGGTKRKQQAKPPQQKTPQPAPSPKKTPPEDAGKSLRDVNVNFGI